jgi:hypothetical protein
MASRRRVDVWHYAARSATWVTPSEIRCRMCSSTRV